MATQITIRGVSPILAKTLKKLSEERGQSLNATVVQLLEEATGIDRRRARLDRYVTWTPEDLREFEEALRAQRTIDEALWR